MTIRTRIAPSPTGMLHIGTARTALFNYLFARKHGGKFLVRIEDTDTARNTKESYDAIIESLDWLGMNPDETIEYQSKRYNFYKGEIDVLIRNGSAYYSYITLEEVERRKEEFEKRKERYIHRYSEEDIKKVDGVQPVIRLKVQKNVHVIIDDTVQGKVIINTDTVEDFVLARSDGTPVYMFAVVCDDIDMKISHVIRGSDHLTNTAKQILLYQAFGAELPIFAHIPLIHGEDGSKLSKRHGAVSTMEYKAQGFLPEALKSYLLRLGWSNGTDDILNEEEAIQAFSLEGIGRAPSRFDIAKLLNINEFFIKNSENIRLKSILEKDYDFNSNLVCNIESSLNVAKSRSKTMLELRSILMLFAKDFTIKQNVDAAKVKKIQEFMSNMSPNKDLHDAFKLFLEKNNIKFKDLGLEFRIMLIGEASSIGVFEIISALGFDEAKKRVLSFKNVL